MKRIFPSFETLSRQRFDPSTNQPTHIYQPYLYILPLTRGMQSRSQSTLTQASSPRPPQQHKQQRPLPFGVWSSIRLGGQPISFRWCRANWTCLETRRLGGKVWINLTLTLDMMVWDVWVSGDEDEQDF